MKTCSLLIGSLFFLTLNASADQAEEHFERGTQHRREGRIDKAIDEFKEAVRIDPKHYWANYALGYANFYLRNDLVEAKKWFRKHIEFHPDVRDSAAANYQLCKILLTERSLDEATPFCARALELDPNDPAATHTQGRLLDAKRDYSGAERFFRRTIELNPLYGEALWNLGGVFQKQNKTAEAMKTWDEAAKICASADPGVVCSPTNARWSRMHQAGCIPGTAAMGKPECQRSFR